MRYYGDNQIYTNYTGETLRQSNIASWTIKSHLWMIFPAFAKPPFIGDFPAHLMTQDGMSILMIFGDV
jgi:hypothetical protein